MQKLQHYTTGLESGVLSDTANGPVDFDSIFAHFLDNSLDDKTRVIHIEQEVERCRIRKRTGGLLTEQVIESASFAAGLKKFLQQKFSHPAIEVSPLQVRLKYRNVDCNVECHCYSSINGQHVVLQVYHERNTPDSLDQFSLNPESIKTLRRELRRTKGGMTIISSHSTDLLCDLYYALLGELVPLDTKVISFESSARRALPRINQVIPRKQVWIPEDVSQIFIDWQLVRDSQLVNKLIANYEGSTLFVQAPSLPAAIRQISDVAISERQLATNLQCLAEIDRVRLVCPHCASAFEPSSEEISLLSENGIRADSALNYAPGCDACNHTGFGEDESLLALYRMNDILRCKVESRRETEIGGMLSGSGVRSVENQKKEMIRKGRLEFRPSDFSK